MTEQTIYRGPSGKGPRIVAIGGGTGLRILTDCYVYARQKESLELRGG